jgi:hypothetical protein
MSSEPTKIWLQPWCDGCETHCESDNGRQWCPDDIWGICEECGNKSVCYEISEPVVSIQSL